MAAPKRTTYVSGGQMLERPPLTVRLTSSINSAYNFFGLYFTSLLSFDPYTAAQNSRFNLQGADPSTRGTMSGTRAAPPTGSSSGLGGWFNWASGSGSGSGGSGSGSGGNGGGGAGRRIGRVDDVRAPECGSCR